ncbi:hypothetical protein BJV82DRAFT_15588 [Fennellomyces sp. T-0311]|nr:hypothetical protein BJV82DRAFT_15588 [Fennellomyces sp. T-0311]
MTAITRFLIHPVINSVSRRQGVTVFSLQMYCQNMLKRNESIVIEKVEVDNKDRYYCPYQQCERDYSGSPNLYSHIRECHDAGYDPFPTKRWKVFKTPKGEVINFKSETCRNMLMQSEVITVEYLKGKVRFYCPYEGCVRTFHNCRLLYCHIRDVHYEDYPSLNSGQRVSKAPNGDILHFDDENCRNVLKNGDTIIVEISECFFCPYQKCNYSCDSYTTLSNHIRKSHYAEFPCIRSSTRRCKTSDGKEINFNSESCRDMLKPDDVIIIEDLNRIDNFYCPYEGCLNSYVVISNLYVHIRREHYPDFPKLIQGRVPKTSHGDVIDWKSEGCRNMLKLGEKMVFDAEECELSYCPYKGCSVNCKSRISFVKHIRKYHCTDCPGLTSATRIYKTPNGDILELDKESCRDTLDHGDTIIAEDPNKITDRKYFYCPYQGCVFKLTERSKIYVHIRKNHYSELGKIVIPRPLCKTEQGDTLHLDSESCRNMLNSGDKILIEPINSEEARNFCPYKGCSKKSVQVGSIYEHIRRMHKQHLPKIGNCRRSAYGTAQGKIVTFDEECRDLLEEGEKLTVLRAPAINSGVSYCPYEGCSVSTNYRHLFGHIRNKHDREFRKLGPNPSISIYTGPLGNLILFDESSRGTVKEGERITVNDFRR